MDPVTPRDPTRLGLIAQALAETIRAAPPTVARRAAIAAAEFALSRVPTDEDALARILDALKAGVGVPASLLERAKGELDRCDDAYLSAQERDEETESLRLFHIARAANAVVEATRPDPYEAACEAAYEAHAATGDLNGVVGAVRRGLSRVE